MQRNQTSKFLATINQQCGISGLSTPGLKSSHIEAIYCNDVESYVDSTDKRYITGWIGYTAVPTDNGSPE